MKGIEQYFELDEIAERAGGYVAPPEYIDENDEGMRRFSAIRQYSLRTGKPIAQLTEED